MRWRFIRSDTLVSHAITAFEVGGPSHVDAVFADGYFGARATPSGGKPAGTWLRPFDYIAPTWEAFVTLPATPEQDAAWEAALRSKQGAPYDYGGAFSFALPFEIHNPRAEFCSALQVWAACTVGRVPKLPKPDWEIDPEEWWMVLAAMGAESQVQTCQS